LNPAAGARIGHRPRRSMAARPALAIDRTDDSPVEARRLLTRRQPAAYVTCKTPFMPSFACESTVHLYGSLPRFKVTVMVVRVPGPMILEVCPAMEKSWAVFPVFLIAKVTFPRFTFLVESTNEKSFMVTLTVVAFGVCIRARAGPVTAGAASAAATITIRLAGRTVMLASSRFAPTR